ncbi:carboxylesterase family protein [Hominifimenecus sp. rT4P-3]|uniref:carboxylesterase family protein n=1 Tax=Hominifimenecus sp. rT4P-3 TaxID=3242979 RepID=UPI003DA59866
MEEIIVAASCGSIRGNKTEGGYQFLGIPYGKVARFRAPEPVSWRGVKDCRNYGPKALQPNYLGVKPEGVPLLVQGSEDCLNLNVWTKSIDREARLPVVVYVHGGAFQIGSNAVPGRSGDRFMEDEAMVFVSVNYRLGVLGFLQLGEEYEETYAPSGNNGMKDLLLAIRWVRENIRDFGGEPSSITFLGISAGAKAIASLITLPEVQAVCHRMVLESGAMQAFRSKKTADEIYRRYLDYLPKGVYLPEVSGAELIRAQAAFCGREGSTCFFGPVLDEEFFSSQWKNDWRQGLRWSGKAIIGCGKRELVPLTEKPAFAAHREQILQDLFGDNSPVAWEKYRELKRQGKKDAQAWGTVLSDFMYRSYSDGLARQLEQERNQVWCYSFEYPPAFHGMGFHFLMDQWNLPVFGVQEEQMEEVRSLAALFRSAIRKFILSGDPGTERLQWPQYEGKNKMIFDAIPHMESRRHDTLEGFPKQVFCLEKKHAVST